MKDLGFIPTTENEKKLDAHWHTAYNDMQRENRELESAITKLEKRLEETQKWLDEFQGVVAEKEIEVLKKDQQIERLKEAVMDFCHPPFRNAAIELLKQIEPDN